MQHPSDRRNERSRIETVRSTLLPYQCGDYRHSFVRRMHPRQCRLLFGHVAILLSVWCFVLGTGSGRAVGDTTSRVSVSSGGDEGEAASSRASVSADGRYVAFYSDASTLVPGDQPPDDPDTCPGCDGVRDVFVRDRQTGVTIRVSVDSAGQASRSFRG